MVAAERGSQVTTGLRGTQPRSGGSSETASIRSLVNGCGNASRRRVEELPDKRRLADAVNGVAGDGQVDGGEVNADLVHPARLEPDA